MSDNENVFRGDGSNIPGAKVQPGLFDMNGKPIKLGNDDPNVIGLDDKFDFVGRGPNSYPNLPDAVKDAEFRFVFPLGQFIAKAIGITLLDDEAYNRVLKAIRSRSVFVVLNLYKCQVREGEASWFGLTVQCKKHPIVLVKFRLRLSTGQIGISQIRFWSSAAQRYEISGDPSGNSFIPREKANAMILNYLNQEGVIPGI
tara:strand:+ start:157950 stop:158549 length:600 start_codon:yes stop_codon:yes gene_type:complete